MKFPISDVAAITFGGELYTNLIGRQAPIDAAITEGRKAIYVEIDPVEWATPVLFVGDQSSSCSALRSRQHPFHRRKTRWTSSQRAEARSAPAARGDRGWPCRRGCAGHIAAVRLGGHGGAGPANERSFAVQVEQSDGSQRLWLSDNDLSRAVPMTSAPNDDEVEPDWDPDPASGSRSAGRQRQRLPTVHRHRRPRRRKLRRPGSTTRAGQLPTCTDMASTRRTGPVLRRHQRMWAGSGVRGRDPVRLTGRRHDQPRCRRNRTTRDS